MTPEDRELDPSSLFKSNTLRLFRLAKAKYGNLSGIGAAVTGGRWNRIGQEAIYTSSEVSTPWLERLVHTPKNLIPTNLALMEIHLEVGDFSTQMGGNVAVFQSLGVARSHWREMSDPKSLWSPVAIALPSVIVPAWNVVLYPGARHFWDHVHLASVEPVEFDPRLFSPDAIPEAV